MINFQHDSKQLGNMALWMEALSKWVYSLETTEHDWKTRKLDEKVVNEPLNETLLRQNNRELSSGPCLL